MVVSVANYVLGPVALVPIMFTWFALYVFAFFGRKEAMGYMAVMALAFALVITEQDITSPVVRWLLGIVTPLVGGLLLSMVVRLAMDRTGVLEDSEAQTRAIIESAPERVHDRRRGRGDHRSGTARRSARSATPPRRPWAGRWPT